MGWSYRMSPSRASCTANTCGGLEAEGWGEPARRTTALKCHVFPAGAERRRRLPAHEARGPTSRHHPAALPRVFSGGHVPRPLRDECHVPGVRTPVRARTRFVQGAMYVSYGIGIVYIGVLASLPTRLWSRSSASLRPPAVL